jgi:hypothetical protein
MPHRDMSEIQYRAALERNGFTSQGFMGYYDLGIPGHKIATSVYNAGATRRAKLAYLLRQRDMHQEQIEKERGQAEDQMEQDRR